MATTLDLIRKAGTEGKILPSTLKNLESWISAGFLPAWATSSLDELVAGEKWEELNNRFFKTIAFGTGGMRDRTIAYFPTKAETGVLSSVGTPAHAAVGSTMLNDFNIIRASMGLYNYCAAYLHAKTGRDEKPRIVIAHDVRHFSKHFTELAASTFTKMGGRAYIFDGPRSTPQLSFSVRYLHTTCGVVITASHNPPAYNGFKAYFEDGGQVVSPHAEGIIDQVNAADLSSLTRFMEKDLTNVVVLPKGADEAYMAALAENFTDTAVIAKARPKVVYTPIHGTGAVGTPTVMRNAGVDVIEVPEQMVMDPRFPTVKSPNPEEGEALRMGIALAEKTGADCVLATDPDADRMGVAIRGHDGKLKLITGNTIGSLMAEYRIRAFKRAGLIPAKGTKKACMIKTFVTTPLQADIARAHGLKLIDTLTGFKFIGDKLSYYEKTLAKKLIEKEGLVLDYDKCSAEARRKLLLKYSTLYVFGGEESYGYLATDRVRDKDANAAAIVFCEMMASLKSEGKTVQDFIDELYLTYGYYKEELLNIYYEGASGSAKIANILKSYRANPPKSIGGKKVLKFKDFGTMTFKDADGVEIPSQDFYFVELQGGYCYAVRGSGTEPKIKFYFFGKEKVESKSDLDKAAAAVSETMAALKAAVDKDARARAEG
ncbi:MAG TPA: phospho-sugar mutase [Opitutales bacterium]|nr:phospho-sugar mutase [Opitutales bacterium]